MLDMIIVGSTFNGLAKKNGKPSVKYVLGGIGIYILSTLIGSFLIGMLLGVFNPLAAQNTDDMILGFAGIPFGIIATVIYYRRLKKKWNLESQNELSELGKQ